MVDEIGELYQALVSDLKRALARPAGGRALHCYEGLSGTTVTGGSCRSAGRRS